MLAGEIGIVRWGDSNAPAVMLVHGWAGRGTQLGFLLDPLLQLGYQVVAFDGPGHGFSKGHQTTIPMFSDALMKVIEEIGEVRCIVAHSFGGSATALTLARGARVESAVLVAVPASIRWIFDNFCRRMKLSERGAHAFVRYIETWTGYGLDDLSIEKLAPKIKASGLVVHDPEDKDVPFSNAEEIVQHWKKARLVTLVGVGHRKILKSSDFVRAVCDFVGPAQTASKMSGSVTVD